MMEKGLSVMARQLVALLVSSAVLVGAMSSASSAQSPSAQAGNPVTSSVRDAKADRNSTPLPPGGAAGIRQAQGNGETVWNIVGLAFFGGVIAAMIFVGNPEDSQSVTTTTTTK
jgi:hypothetical protein